jgi:hypothetical protein
MSIDSIYRGAAMPLDEHSGAAAISEVLDPSSHFGEVTAEPTSRVKFADEDQVKLMTPMASHHFGTDPEHDEEPIPSPSSGVSTPSSEVSVNTSPVAKTLADRLSFWSRLSKRTSLPPGATEEHADAMKALHEAPSAGEQEALLAQDGEDGTIEPREVLHTIVQGTAPAPETQAAQNLELENKVVRECIREYTKGGMYFSYHFGKFLLSFTIERRADGLGRHYSLSSAQTRDACQKS